MRGSGFGLKFGGGWAPGGGEVIASRSFSGNWYDRGPESKKDMACTDTFQIVRVSG